MSTPDLFVVIGWIGVLLLWGARLFFKRIAEEPFSGLQTTAWTSSVAADECENKYCSQGCTETLASVARYATIFMITVTIFVLVMK